MNNNMWWIDRTGAIQDPPEPHQLAEFDQREAEQRDLIQSLIDITLSASSQVHHGQDPSATLGQLTGKLEEVLADRNGAMNVINALITEQCRALAYRAAMENAAVHVLYQILPALPPTLSQAVAQVYSDWFEHTQKPETDDALPSVP